MKYKEVKEYYESGKLRCHFLEDENGRRTGEYRDYHDNGQLWWNYFFRNKCVYGEIKIFNDNGTLYDHQLKDGKGNEIATVIEFNKPSTHTEEQLIQIAKEHNLPLISELPKTEAERTLWNLKYPDMPCLPNAST